MKIAKKEIGIALALTLTIAVISVFYNTTPQRDAIENRWGLQSTNFFESTQTLTS